MSEKDMEIKKMAEDDILKSTTDLVGMNAENIIEMENDLIDKLPEKVEEDDAEFSKFIREMGKSTSDIMIHNKQMEHRIDEVNEVLKETEGKLDDTVNNVDGAFSGVISDSDGIGKGASEILRDIKDELERFPENICKITNESENGLEELEKMEKRIENVLGVMNTKSEVVANVGEMVSEMYSKFEEVDKEMPVGAKVGKAVDNQLVENVDGTIPEKVDTSGDLGSEIIEKTSVKSEEKEKMDEFIKETCGMFGKLNEEVNKEILDVEESAGKKLPDFKEGIDEKISKDSSSYGSDDKAKQVVGREDSVAAAEDLRGDVNTDYLQCSTFRKDTEEVEKVVEEILPKSGHDNETQATKKIITPGENVPEQLGTLSESGVYHDDYDMEKPDDIVTTKAKDIVNNNADEVDKLLEEAHNISEKLKEPETVDGAIDQEDAVDIHKVQNVVPDPSCNSVSSPFLKSSTIQTALVNTLQSNIPVKGNDRDEMITEAPINRIQEKDRPELQGFKTLVQGTENLEIGRDEVKSNHKAGQNAEIPATKEKAEAIADEDEANDETMQKSESKKTDTTPPIPNQMFEAEKTNAHLILSPEERKPPPIPNQMFEAEKTGAHLILSPEEGKPEVASERDETNKVKPNSSHGQQQQSRRCAIL